MGDGFALPHDLVKTILSLAENTTACCKSEEITEDRNLLLQHAVLKCHGHRL